MIKLPMQQVRTNLYNIGFQTVRELESEHGILASAATELYGCLFGRDSLLTGLKLLQVYKRTQSEDCLRIVKKSLKALSTLQGKEVNIESGEEPGKMIHEYRPTGHEHLTKNAVNPWYVYPDNIMRNYDTVDATPLFLITLYRYGQIAKDEAFIEELLPNVDMALHWILNYADGNGDGFIDYSLNPNRKYGGLTNQNWMDSVESSFHEDGAVVKYPLAPVEAQAYVYYAIKLWEQFYLKRDTKKAIQLAEYAQKLKRNFNESFIIFHDKYVYLASAIDDNGRPLKSIRSSIGHALWASLSKEVDGRLDGIVETHYVHKIVKRLLAHDMFDPKAGIRTLSMLSRNFQPNSYHNGSIWPHDNSLIAEGLDNYGFNKEANTVRKAYLHAIAHFNTPIELFVYWNKKYSEYTELNGRTGSKQQAWSAASVLADTLIISNKKSLPDALYRGSMMLMLLEEVHSKKLQKVIRSTMKRVTHTVPLKPISLARKVLPKSQKSNN